MRFQSHNIVGMRSPMGSGKTFANAQVVEELVRANPKMKVLVISMRVALASKYKDDYKGFVCYLDETKARMLMHEQLICQLDSLNRVQWVKAEGTNHLVDMVVLDEGTQALKHLVSTTYMKNPNVKNNIAKFKQLIKGAKQIVLMDANLDSDTMFRIKEIRNNPADTAVVYWNEYEMPARNIQMTTAKEDIIRLVKAQLNANKRSFVASNNSCESILTTRDILQKHKPSAKILVICTTTLNLPEVKEALIDPNACWGKYDVVLCSPSVQSGVSYDVRDTFDSIFGMFGNSTNSSGDVCQMLCRVRHPKSNDVVVSFECNNGLISGNGGDITNRDEYIRYLSKVRNFAQRGQLPTFTSPAKPLLISKISQNPVYPVTQTQCPQ